MRNNEDRIGTNKQNLQDQTPSGQLSDNGLDLNFIVPTEFVELPSRGRFYPPGHALHGKDVIEIRQMTAKEEDILTSRSLLKKGVALDKLIQSLIVDKSINPDLLTVEDRTAIIISARISGYGPEYVTSVSCPNCGEKSKYSFDLSEKLPKFDEDEEEEQEKIEINNEGNFFMVLPSTKWLVECKAMNGIDEKTLSRISELKKKSSNDSTLLDQLKMVVVSIKGITERIVIDRAINALPAGDCRYIIRQYEKVVERFDMKQLFSCPKCNEDTEMEVPLTADFFWFK